MKTRFAIAIMLSALLGGCHTPVAAQKDAETVRPAASVGGQESANGTIHKSDEALRMERYRSLIGSGRYLEAFHLMPQILEDTKDIPEAASSFELSLLLSETACRGERQWVSILKDPTIALEYKIELVEFIHGEAEYMAMTASGSAVKEPASGDLP